ncbi:hypothetical protein LVX13_10050 [Streptomyces albulus]|uniref:hypothetical protein n=1 Tax=Streptomyces noursei TaxID=1971 RepID=UPI001F179747|nr:hypothetical protein [Streptomyces noursei]MCE4943470.1 hypothetical protein [Streptomyces noursei]
MNHLITSMFDRLRTLRLHRRTTTGGPVTRTRLPGRPADDLRTTSVQPSLGGDELRARALLRALIDGGRWCQGAGR